MFARVVQGIGGGMLIPVTMAIVYELFEPEERGQALGIWGVAVMAAPAVGPVLGGTVVSEIGWRWLFLVNVPIGVVGVFLTMRLLRETGGGVRRRLDTAGLVGASAGIVLLLVGLAEGGLEGFSSPAALVPLVTSVIVFAGFVVHSLRVDHPIVDLRILQHPVFSRAIVVLVLTMVAQFTRLVYVPLELGTTRDIERADPRPRDAAAGDRRRDRDADQRPAHRPHRRPAAHGDRSRAVRRIVLAARPPLARHVAHVHRRDACSWAGSAPVSR